MTTPEIIGITAGLVLLLWLLWLAWDWLNRR